MWTGHFYAVSQMIMTFITFQRKCIFNAVFVSTNNCKIIIADFKVMTLN